VLAMFVFAVTFVYKVNAQETTEVNLVILWSGGGLSIWQSGALNMGSVYISSSQQVLESQFTWEAYFWVEDLFGSNTGYQTTVSLSNLSGQNTSAFIPNENVEIKVSSATAILHTGSANPAVVVGSGTQFESYRVWWDNVFVFLNRPAGVNNGLVGMYKTFPRLKVTVPAYQSVDSYKWVITYTLY